MTRDTSDTCKHDAEKNTTVRGPFQQTVDQSLPTILTEEKEKERSDLLKLDV